MSVKFLSILVLVLAFARAGVSFAVDPRSSYPTTEDAAQSGVPITSAVEGDVAAGKKTHGVLVGKTEAGLLSYLKTDATGGLITTALTGFGADFSFGDVTTAAVTQVVVRRTVYTEQTTNAQRSILSANANDSSAGTGARTVRITYLTSTGTGPFTEIVTMNGTTPVNTVSTTICFIEKIEVVTVGSTGSNAGILTLKAATAGGGATIGTINATDNRTFWAHHYVPTGKQVNVTGLSVNHNGTTVGSGALFVFKWAQIGVANGAEVQVSDFHRLYGQSSTIPRTYVSPIKINGPGRVIVYVTPETTTSTVYRASIDFFQP